MEEKTRINNFIKDMYVIYSKNNFNFFVEKCLNYNIKIGNYKKNIIQLSKKVFSKIIAQCTENKAKIEYKELKFSFNLSVKKIDNNINTERVILDIPVFEDNYEKIATILTNFLIQEKIEFSIYLYKLIKNSFFKISFSNYNDAKKVVNYFLINEELVKEIKSRCVQFLYQENLIGIYSEIKPYNFKNFYILNLYKFFSKINNEENATLEEFNKYINRLYKNENKLNKKRMYFLLNRYFDSIINNSNLDNFFIDNLIMNIGSYNPNEYILKLDESKTIYFYNEEDQTTITYGTEDYLNIIYSKYYENVIKKDKSDKFYNDFYNVYDEILSSNYKKINNILNLINNNMDVINKQLIIISSAYFAYKKMNFSLDQIYKIIDYALSKLLYENSESSHIETTTYILNDEYGNKIINLKDGTITTIKEYLLKHNIINNIPNNCIIHLKNGNTISGKNFIDNIYKVIDKYNNYNDLSNDLINLIEYK